MSESKFTPGPWLRTDGSFVYALNERGTNVFWAHVQAGWQGVDAEYLTRLEEVEANAKLIAAAPDLLESLTNLVGLARLGAARIDKYHAALAVADAAIAKATA